LFFFKFWLTDENVPVYAGNIAAAFFGSIITIAITAVLLKQQTEIETSKEYNLKITETKIELYTKLMDEIEKAIASDVIGKDDAVNMLILNRKIAFVASMGVLKALNELTAIFSVAVNDGNLNITEKKQLMISLGKLSIEIRKDIISDVTEQDEKLLSKSMDEGVKAISGKIQERSGFTLSTKEKESFNELIKLLQKASIKWRKGQVGFSVQDSRGKSIAHIYPEVSSKESNILVKSLSNEQKQILEAHCDLLGVASVLKEKTIQIPQEMSNSDLVRILSELQ